ncbi:MAG: trypsin-like peptidase domain-containing protein [Patescibacteria group bacterium]|nr:trypsin-like peptidase domain-containing protein [Patescibacteria group bacterium]MDE2116427.1 trypsin-like peptidase domain-containing protein [Patescibacteria group bacterium]
MEQLTKQQIVLLCLLVSLVSAVAVGTVIVSLVYQAPAPVTQTVSHVIERSSGAPAASQTTVVVKSYDQAVTSAIASADKSVARITDASGRFIAVGVFVGSAGRIAASIEPVSEHGLEAHLADGTVVPVTFLSTDQATDLSFFQSQSIQKTYPAASLADSDALKLGESVIALSDTSTTTVALGIVSSLDATVIQASPTAGLFDSQAILVNLAGEVVGVKKAANIKIQSSSATASFIPSNVINAYATS